MSESTQYSVAQLLVELKLLTNRIQKATGDMIVVGAVPGSKVPTGFTSQEEFSSTLKSQYQSAVALIERRNKVKAALVLSNATTLVSIGGKSMAVAEAIERKNSIVYDKQLLNQLVSRYNQTKNSVDQANRDVEQRKERLLEAVVGKERSSDEALSAAKKFMEDNEFKVIDPLDVKKRIESLQADIENFEADVDLALSTSNAVTMVVL